MSVVTLSDPAATAECSMVAGQDCFRGPYSPEGYSECGSTWNSYSPEFSGPYTDFPMPTSDEEHLVPNSANWVPWAPSDYPHVPNGYACTPGHQPFAYSPSASSDTVRQPLDTSTPPGLAPIYCFPSSQHTPFPTHFGFCARGSRTSDEVLPPTHTSADASHMETTVPPLEVARSLMHANVTLHSAYPSSSEMNGYPNPMYIPPSSNGFMSNGTSEGLPRPGSQSPEARISFDSPKFKLTQERALPLVRWYEEHKDHPYPSRQEKLHLCQTTQLTYTQVSTWFANARRRNKKRELGQGSASSDEGEL